MRTNQQLIEDLEGPRYRIGNNPPPPPKKKTTQDLIAKRETAIEKGKKTIEIERQRVRLLFVPARAVHRTRAGRVVPVPQLPGPQHPRRRSQGLREPRSHPRTLRHPLQLLLRRSVWHPKVETEVTFP